MTPYYADDWLQVFQGDCRAVMAELPAESVHCVVTSPPYFGLRDYGTEGQLGFEATPEAYVEAMVAVFREVRRVMRPDATLWLNLGDSYAGGGKGGNPEGSPWSGFVGSSDREASAKASKPYLGLAQKQLLGIPWRVAFALQADGWYLRSDIIWAKPNPMPESVTDRPTKSHEYLFLLAKSARYYFDAEAVREAAEYAGPNGAQHSPYGQGFTRRSTQQSDKQRASVAVGIGNGHHVAGLNERWDASEDAGTAPLGRNIRSVWTVATQPYPGAHFATFPRKLIEPCIKAGCPEGGTVLDPFAGSGTTGLVAQSLSRRAILIDLNADYLVQAMNRNRDIPLGLAG